MLASADEAEGGQNDGDGPAAGNAPHFSRRGAALQANHGGEEKEVGQEERDDRHADQHVVGAADRGSGLAENSDDHARSAIDGDGDPGGAIARVNPAEGRRQIAIDADDEGQACGGQRDCRPRRQPR